MSPAKAVGVIYETVRLVRSSRRERCGTNRHLRRPLDGMPLTVAPYLIEGGSSAERLTARVSVRRRPGPNSPLELTATNQLLFGACFDMASGPAIWPAMVSLAALSGSAARWA